MRLLRGLVLALSLASLAPLAACVQQAPARSQPAAACGCPRR